MEDEKRAVERLKAGDIEGLAVLVDRFYAGAAKSAYLIVRDRSLAEDVVQTAFVRLWEKIDLFDESRPFGPWFTKLVVNDAVRAASRRERSVSFYGGDAEEFLDRLADPGAGPAERAEEMETERRVWRALEQLPPAQRAVIVQRYYLGMSEAEMAESISAPSGTIKSRLSAARKRLSKLLRPEAFIRGLPEPLTRPTQRTIAKTPKDLLEERRGNRE